MAKQLETGVFRSNDSAVGLANAIHGYYASHKQAMDEWRQRRMADAEGALYGRYSQGQDPTQGSEKAAKEAILTAGREISAAGGGNIDEYGNPWIGKLYGGNINSPGLIGARTGTGATTPPATPPWSAPQGGANYLSNLIDYIRLSRGGAMPPVPYAGAGGLQSGTTGMANAIAGRMPIPFYLLDH